MGAITNYLIVDHRVHTRIVFITRTARTADFEAFRSGDYQLEPEEVEEEAIQRAKVIHASTSALSREPCRSAIENALKLAQKHNKIISLDLNYSPLIWPDYQEAKQVIRRMSSYASISKPSLDGAMRFFGRGKEPEGIR